MTPPRGFARPANPPPAAASPARSRRAPYKPASRSVVGAACRPPVQFYLACHVPGGLYIPRIWFFILDALRTVWVCFGLPETFLFDRAKRNRKTRRYFRGAGHGQGACGPLWKPRGSEEVARDSPHASQPFGRFYPSPGPCLPEPLIRAPVLKPRPPSRAGAAASRSVVGAACRPPVQFDLAVNARCCISVPAPCRAGS